MKVVQLIQPFFLSCNITYFQSRSCSTGSWYEFQKKITFRAREKGGGEGGGGGGGSYRIRQNNVSCEHVDINACDHSKQGLETQIASETHNHPKPEVTDSCESSKKCTR